VDPFIASARTLYPATFPRVNTRTRTVLSARLGYRSTLLIDDAGVGSSHTVCQIPDVGV
jgi:hypothetical protein